MQNKLRWLIVVALNNFKGENNFSMHKFIYFWYINGSLIFKLMIYAE